MHITIATGTQKGTLQTAIHKNIHMGSTLYANENPSYKSAYHNRRKTHHHAYVNESAFLLNIDSLFPACATSKSHKELTP